MTQKILRKLHEIYKNKYIFKNAWLHKKYHIHEDDWFRKLIHSYSHLFRIRIKCSED